jgi:putative FmdB family regulatory protein
MPVYVFTCTVCGRFEESRPMARAARAARRACFM